MKKLPHRTQRIVLAHRLVTVNCKVPEILDHLRLCEDGAAHAVAEGWFVNERVQAVLIREAQGGIVLVEPRYGQLQSAPGVEACRSWVGVGQSLRFGGGFQHFGPFGGEEMEITVHRFKVSSASPSTDIISSKESGSARNIGRIAR